MKDIESRKDISLLVRTFYQQVRKDSLLAPVFEEVIEDWEHHLERITDFWETNLFLSIHKYHGNPLETHVNVDDEVGNIIVQQHFSRWLLIWTNTIDSLFVGDKAHTAKMRARKMGTYLFMKVFENQHK
ncbi:MAG: group III truncated hemoglobin [Cytophagales bacterium]|nr:group III truncated hemoglobin [Cytophagales bacterium]